MKPTARPTDDIAGGWWDGVGCWVGSDVMARCWFRFRFWYPSGLQSADRRYWRRLSVVAIVGQEWLRMRGSRSSGGVCKNEPANEPSELATLHRNGDAWGEHLTGCGYNEPACVCTWMCQRSGEPSDRRMDALRGVHVQNCHLHLFGTNITLLGIKCSFIKSMWIIHNRNGIGFIGTLVSIMDHQRSYETHASFLPHSAATFHFGNGWRVEKASDLFVCTKHSSMRSLVSGSSSFLLFRLTPLTQLRLIPAAWTWTCHTRIWTPASHLFGLVDEYVRIAGSSSLCLSWNWAAWAALPAHTHTHTHTDRHEHSWHILVQTIRRLKYSQQDAGKHPGHTGHLLLPLLNVASFLPILLEPICLAYGLNVLDFAFAFYGGSYGSERIYLLAPHFAGHRLVVIKSGLTKLISNYECISKEVLFIQFLSRKFGC